MSDTAYEGIDLANGLDNLGRCFLRDDGNRLTVEIDEPSVPIMRTAIDCLFGANTKWMSNQVRDIQPATLPDELKVNHHRFDAFLCALTAWAHHHGECVGWESAEIEPGIVDIEGHILVLRQTERG